ncbi:MAG: hypothetical protein H7833_07185 [Magnetococcus sp. DMHC-1]
MMIPPPNNSFPETEKDGNFSVWKVLFISWLATIILTVFFIIPHEDDIFYFAQGLNLAKRGSLSIPIQDHEIRLFSIFGTLPFFHSLFQRLFDLIHIPLNFHTYRLFTSIIAIVNIILALWYIRITSPQDATCFRRRSALFLFLISTTYYSMSWMVVRPEFIGLSFFLAALIADQSFLRQEKSPWHAFPITGILFGTSAICHPVCTILTGPTALVIAIREWKRHDKNHLKPLLLVLFGIFPALVLLSYYTYYRQDSIPSLLLHVCELLGPFYWNLIADYLPSLDVSPETIWGTSPTPHMGEHMISNPLMASFTNIFNIKEILIFLRILIYLIPYYLILIATFTLGWKKDNIRTGIQISFPYRYPFIVSVILIHIIVYSGMTFYGFLGFMLTILLVQSNGCRMGNWISTRFSKKLIKIGLVLSILYILSWPLLHIGKHIAIPNHFPDPLKIQREVNHIKHDIDYLFLLDSTIVPVFISDLEKTMAHDSSATFETYWIFPTIGTFLTNKEAKFIKGFFDDIIKNKSKNKMAWYIKASDAVINDESVCINIPKNNIEIYFKISRIVYKDNKNYILTSNGFTTKCAR